MDVRKLAVEKQRAQGLVDMDDLTPQSLGPFLRVRLGFG